MQEIKRIARQLENNHIGTELNLSIKDIDDQEVSSLAEALKINSSLLELYLAGNLIEDQGTVALAEALKINSSLTKLALSRNPIGAQGIAALAEMLKINSSLTHLYLYHNQIGNEGAFVILNALKANTTLTTLDLGGNQISPEIMNVFNQTLEENQKLQELKSKPEYKKEHQKILKARVEAVTQEIKALQVELETESPPEKTSLLRDLTKLQKILQEKLEVMYSAPSLLYLAANSIRKINPEILRAKLDERPHLKTPVHCAFEKYDPYHQPSLKQTKQ